MGGKIGTEEEQCAAAFDVVSHPFPLGNLFREMD